MADTTDTETTETTQDIKGFLDADGLNRVINGTNGVRAWVEANASNISTNASNISTNASNISTNASNISRLDVAGRLIWYFGKTRPDGYLLCNGEDYSRTTYARLFAAIGTTYGSGDGSTTFNVPNLMANSDFTDGNNAIVGCFVRAATSTSAVGTTQSDAIRNIIGYADRAISDKSSGKSGALFDNGSHSVGFGGGSYVWRNLGFNANNDATVNPMGNHANGADCHPFNIALLPLISF